MQHQINDLKDSFEKQMSHKTLQYENKEDDIIAEIKKLF